MTTLLSAPELAAELGVHRSTIHRRIERGELEPAGTVAGRPVFRREDAEALVRGERTLPPEEPPALKYPQARRAPWPERKDAAAPELPAVGSLWRFKSSKTVYQVRSADADLIQLQSTVTEHTRTSVPLRDVARRLVAVEEATA